MWPSVTEGLFRVVIIAISSSSRDDVAYFRGCTDGSLLLQMSWRRDFLGNPDDFPASRDTKRLWRRQVRLIRRELRNRGVRV